MSLHIKIMRGEVVTWEYRGTAEPTAAPVYRAPIHTELEPALLRRVAIAMGQTSWDLLKRGLS